MKKATKNKIMEILDLTLELNGKGGYQIFFEYSGHVEMVGFYVRNSTDEVIIKNIRAYIDFQEELLKDILKILKNFKETGKFDKK